MIGRSITKNCEVNVLSADEVSELTRQLTPEQRKRIENGEDILVRTDRSEITWKEYWLGKGEDE